MHCIFSTSNDSLYKIATIRYKVLQDAILSQGQPRDAPYIWVPWKLYVSAKSADDCTGHGHWCQSKARMRLPISPL